MGNVALILRVMPESPDIDLNDLTEQIKKKVPGLQDVREEPIGFGLKALKIAVVVGDGTAVTWIAPLDSSKEEVPCMIVDDFKLRDGHLNLSIFFRSHDYAGAYPANLYGLARLLQYVAGEVGAEPGSISTTSASAHIYEHDWDWVERMLFGRGSEQI